MIAPRTIGRVVDMEGSGEQVRVSQQIFRVGVEILEAEIALPVGRAQAAPERGVTLANIVRAEILVVKQQQFVALGQDAATIDVAAVSPHGEIGFRDRVGIEDAQLV